MTGFCWSAPMLSGLEFAQAGFHASPPALVMIAHLLEHVGILARRYRSSARGPHPGRRARRPATSRHLPQMTQESHFLMIWPYCTTIMRSARRLFGACSAGPPGWCRRTRPWRAASSPHRSIRVGRMSCIWAGVAIIARRAQLARGPAHEARHAVAALVIAASCGRACRR